MINSWGEIRESRRSNQEATLIISPEECTWSLIISPEECTWSAMTIPWEQNVYPQTRYWRAVSFTTGEWKETGGQMDCRLPWREYGPLQGSMAPGERFSWKQETHVFYRLWSCLSMLCATFSNRSNQGALKHKSSSSIKTLEKMVKAQLKELIQWHWEEPSSSSVPWRDLIPSPGWRRW